MPWIGSTNMHANHHTEPRTEAHPYTLRDGRRISEWEDEIKHMSATSNGTVNRYITSAEIWPEINAKDSSRYLSAFKAYDEANSNHSLRDYFTWYDAQRTNFSRHPEWLANYILIHTLPQVPMQSLFHIFGTYLKQMRHYLLVRHAAAVIYAAQRKSTVDIAMKLRVGRSGCHDVATLFQRVINLHYARADRPTPGEFCVTLTMGIAFHMPLEARREFYSFTKMLYPSLASKIAKSYNSSMMSLVQSYPWTCRPIPKTAEDVEQYCEYLLTWTESASLCLAERQYSHLCQNENSYDYGLIVKKPSHSSPDMLHRHRGHGPNQQSSNTRNVSVAVVASEEARNNIHNNNKNPLKSNNKVDRSNSTPQTRGSNPRDNRRNDHQAIPNVIIVIRQGMALKMFGSPPREKDQESSSWRKY